MSCVRYMGIVSVGARTILGLRTIGVRSVRERLDWGTNCNDLGSNAVMRMIYFGSDLIPVSHCKPNHLGFS